MIFPLLSLLPTLLLLPSTRAAEIGNCTTFPSWTISGFHSNTTDSVGAGGSASFTLTNNLLNKTDALSCSLQVNYRCIFAGVPSDANLTVNLAVRAESLTLLLDESVSCPGRETPLHIVGNVELDLNCTGLQDIGGTVTCGLADGASTIQGTAVELAPGRRRAPRRIVRLPVG